MPQVSTGTLRPLHDKERRTHQPSRRLHRGRRDGAARQPWHPQTSPLKSARKASPAVMIRSRYNPIAARPGTCDYARRNLDPPSPRGNVAPGRSTHHSTTSIREARSLSAPKNMVGSIRSRDSKSVCDKTEPRSGPILGLPLTSGSPRSSNARCTIHQANLDRNRRMAACVSGH